MKKSKRLFFILAFILLVATSIYGIIGSFSILTTGQQPQGFTLIGEEIYIPQYFTGECIARADNLATIKKTSHTDDPIWYSCTTNEAGKYIPNVNSIQCEYEISDFSTATAYICNVNGGEKPISTDDSRCKKETGFFDIVGDSIRYSVNVGDYIYIDTDKIIGNAQLKVKYPSYGLRIRTADGFVQSTTTSCEANSISSQYHTIDINDRFEILPDAPFNAVTGLQKVMSTQAVTLNDVENGAQIYITRPNYYYKIKEAEDGFKYVATSEGERRSTNIECIPRTTGCSDDAKIINIQDQSCDKYGGSITNYAPVSGDSTKLCKYSCSSGTLKITSDCIQVQTDCPENKPLWDTTTGKCVATMPIESQKVSYSYLWIAGIGIIGALLLRRRALLGEEAKK